MDDHDDDLIRAFGRSSDRRVLWIALFLGGAASIAIGMFHRAGRPMWHRADPYGWAYFAAPLALALAIGLVVYAGLRMTRHAGPRGLTLSNHVDGLARLVLGIGLIPAGIWLWRTSGATAFHDRNALLSAVSVLSIVAGIGFVLMLPPLSLELGDAIRARTLWGLRTYHWSELVSARYITRRHRLIPHLYLELQFAQRRRLELWSTWRGNRQQILDYIAAVRPDAVR